MPAPPPRRAEGFLSNFSSPVERAGGDHSGLARAAASSRGGADFEAIQVWATLEVEAVPVPESAIDHHLEVRQAGYSDSEAESMDPVLLAALAGLAGIAIGRFWDARSEATRWRRDQRIRVYERLITAYYQVR